MKFIIRNDDKKSWHLWFAWYPVTQYHKEKKVKYCIWLQTVERRYGRHGYEYRFLNSLK